ncbi:unnamed protein product [Rhizophagus irregularis]|uniref:Polyubiquitin-C n=3 Tax=Rhizophagus irregularis TaxID=588596 RepID=U9TMK3_RHIID|nr:Polyubiquitin-C [Rhizophagus irregularis DAOM 181602=DAOM 197198]EXX55852.1 ubiquitin-ribosomal 60S subunit protein L40B fusion protein [Rhizophagus irregularis DAOM 197198w]PKC65269.1 Nmr based structural model of the Ubch8-ubiquitin complex [Rhizophagus irregularis]PKK62641.1 Nmr based structural model of the Ubch8-ubiquitin complex [Rhizophagus irregularis]PKY48503.1 Nmr based structural model of the Ubch8-ubiquitin complex [Rhizophagus irregularis]POG76515.1 Polyubiquitin-C [Rhizophagus|eukprot:XP_025183381.1 Polyubiquitin-C [Rhizophagus irregularis DAOM 181602=DAOM 197198]
MQIFIYADRTYTIEVEYHDTVAILKEKFYKKTGINCERQRLRLIHRCKQLEDTRSLSEYNINKESTVYLVHTLLSCKKCPGQK